MLRIHFVKTTVVDIIIKLDMPLTAVTTMLLVQILLVHIRVPVTLAFTVLVNHVPRVHHAVPDLQKQPCEDINECEANQPELLYTNEHPRNEVATAMGCTNGNGVGDATCLAICEADQTCNFVLIYATSGRCCFKSSMTVNAAHPLRTNNGGGGGHYYKVNHASNNCPGDATCANTDGSHTCTCDHPSC